MSTREDIVSTADRLIYQQGYEHTSFSDIASIVNISRGNFYYHFKSKDDILKAVIDARLANTRDALKSWEEHAATPADRIRRFIDMLLINLADIKRYGCPVGTLTAELSKLDHPLHGAANAIFGLFRNWLSEQFIALGHKTKTKTKAKADALAMHLLARSQGVATLASSFGNSKFVKTEVKLMKDWLDSILMESTRA